MNQPWLRVAAGVVLALLATAGGAFAFGLETRPQTPLIVRSIWLGGLLGLTIATVSVGSQVAFTMRRPTSNASFGAMVGGFFAKGLALLAGVFVLHGTGWGHPAAFGVALLVSAGVVTAFGLSALASTRR